MYVTFIDVMDITNVNITNPRGQTCLDMRGNLKKKMSFDSYTLRGPYHIFS